MRSRSIQAVLFVLAALLVLQGVPLQACTTFCIVDGDRPVFGRNLDWSIGVGLVFVNKRGLEKSALIMPTDVPVRWVSKYGSVTFNQYGRELPMGGMNEAGLVVEQMWLSGTKYPAADDRPATRELGWIQYQLDMAATVEEVLASRSRIRITGDSTPLHFHIADAGGDGAVIEFLEGKMVVRRNELLPHRALTNNTYSSSVAYLRTFEEFGGEKAFAQTPGSLDRFVDAVRGITDYSEEERGEIVAHAFKILDTVSQGQATQWTIVYDVRERAISFRTEKAKEVKTLKLAAFDFSAAKPTLLLDIDFAKKGDCTASFEEYTMERNRKLIFDAFKSTSFLKDTPDLVLNMMAVHPETFRRVEEEETSLDE